MSAAAEVGVIGGSGFYRLLEDAERVELDTPWGRPSDALAVGQVGGRRVAFLPRHGPRHTLPPGAINYRANLWALHELGVTAVIAPTASGSLRPEVAPGHLVVPDQLVDRTWGRADSFYLEGPKVAHVSVADPYCPVLRRLAVEAAREAGLTVHERGTVVVIPGPRFATRAESRWYGAQGWEVINMTQYPEAVLARELEMCYVNLSLITDYDAGLEGRPEVRAVSVEEVERVFASGLEQMKRLVLSLIPRLASERTCTCATAMRDAFIGG